jgi:hypothetical protein
MSNVKKQNEASSINKIRIFSENNINKFEEVLDQTDFHHMLEITCPIEAYNEFDQLSKNALESSFPLHEFRNNHTVIKRVPWFTKGLLISAKEEKEIIVWKIA